MEVLRATAMGFCFGVRDALELAFDLDHADKTTLYGEVVHNETVQARLRDKGFHQLPEGERHRAALTSRVLITAHGISNREKRELEEGGHQLIDTTCPLVRRAHVAALTLAHEGYHVIVLGRPDHVEVRGLVGDLSSYSVVSSAADIQRWPHTKLGVLCQTTFPEREAEALLRAIRAANPQAEVVFRDTICEPTKQRQQAIEDLIRAVEVVVVIGGARSHNTQQLAETARRAGRVAHLVQGPADLQAAWFDGCQRVGLTAGTSTPDDLIDAVEDALHALSTQGSVQPVRK